MQIKITIAISIFTFLLISSWFLNEHTKRDHIIFNVKPEMEQNIWEPMTVEAEEATDYWHFKPREYIKVRKAEIVQ